MKRSETKFYDENGFPLTWNMLPPAQCDVNHDCLKCEHDVSGDVIFVEGDFYVIGLLPISTKNPNNLLQCGQIKGLVGADLAQAVVFAVQEVNRKTGVFSVGGVFLTATYSLAHTHVYLHAYVHIYAYTYTCTHAVRTHIHHQPHRLTTTTAITVNSIITLSHRHSHNHNDDDHRHYHHQQQNPHVLQSQPSSQPSWTHLRVHPNTHSTILFT